MIQDTTQAKKLGAALIGMSLAELGGDRAGVLRFLRQAHRAMGRAIAELAPRRPARRSRP